MNRLIYYMIFINMFANIATVVPRVLLAKSTDGALISIGLGLVAGLMLSYIVIRFFSKFPGKGLPELLKIHTSKWFYFPVLLYFGIMWYFAGLATIITYTFILLTFLTPEMAFVTTIMPFLIVLSYGILMKSKSVLYAMEIVFISFIPVGVFIFMKAYLSKQLNWDFVKIAVMNANDYPDYSAFSASVFLFMGVINLAIFNRHFLNKQTVGVKQLAIIAIAGFFILFTTYFLPIGFGGFDGIERLLYPWFSTTDSVRMRFGIIERLVFVFLLFFVSISFISITIHWHVSAQFFISFIHIKKLKWKDRNLTLSLIALVFVAGALLISKNITATELYQYTKFFYNSGMVLIGVLFIAMLAVNRGAKQ